jgi:hypothetical protein
MKTTFQTKRRWLWLLAAGALLLLGALVMHSGDASTRREAPSVRLPKRMSHDEVVRTETRRTLLLSTLDAGVVAAPSRPRDPVLALVPAQLKRGAVVAEFNALVNSDLGALMMGCVFGDENGMLAQLADAGFNASTQVDRVAFIDDNMVVTGDFKQSPWKRLLPAEPVSWRYGDKGNIYQFGDGSRQQTFAVWNGQMMLSGGSEASQRQMIDRLEGRAPSVESAIDESMAYGEVYGLVSADALAQMLGRADPRLSETLRRSANTVSLHLSASHDVGLVADIDGKDAAQSEDLRKALGSALSLARMQAQANGESQNAELLDLARVGAANAGAGFRLEAGLPYEFMQKNLTDCIARQKERRLHPSDAGQLSAQ